MTVLGKILAVLNLVLSLAVGALIVVTFVARTNWHAAYQNKEQQAKVSEADAIAFKAEMEHAKGELAKKNDELAKLTLAADKEKRALNSQLTALADKLKRAAEENSRHVASEGAAAEQLKRFEKEVDYLKTLIAARDTQLSKWQKQVNDMRDGMVEAQINFNAEHERNERLLRENERLVKDNQHIRQVGATTNVRTELARKNPPAEDVAGTITRIDPSSGLVTLSVGSDAGLSKGNTLEVYRLRPTPAYLGTIEILQARPNEAVGRPVAPSKYRPIQVGDQVSSNIMGRS